MIDTVALGALQIKGGSDFSEVRRTTAQSVQLRGVTVGRLAGCGCGLDVGGQRQCLPAKCAELRLHSRPLACPGWRLVLRDSRHAVFQCHPGETVEVRAILPWGQWLGRADREEHHTPALAFAEWTRWLSPLNSRIVA
jgi:hypothetical protein